MKLSCVQDNFECAMGIYISGNPLKAFVLSNEWNLIFTVDSDLQTCAVLQW